MTSVSAIAGLAASTPAVAKKDSPEKIQDAAKQFESLLMQQLLHSMREGSGWLGTGDDAAGSTAADFAEQQFAAALSSGGGLGLASMVSRGLEQDAKPKPPVQHAGGESRAR